jgi:hypothetical protein
MNDVSLGSHPSDRQRNAQSSKIKKEIKRQNAVKAIMSPDK